MQGREVCIKKILGDILAGVDEKVLMEKYRISSKGLQDLYRQLVKGGFLEPDGLKMAVCKKRKISADSIIHDMRAGFTKKDLMSKYLFSSKDFQKLTDKLKATGVLDPDYLCAELDSEGRCIKIEHVPRLPRNYLIYPFTVYVVGNPAASGNIVDITEQGFRVEGIQARVGQTITFSFVPDSSEIKPFVLDAICRWVDLDAGKTFAAGFQIVTLSEHNRRELRKLIDSLAPGG